MLPGQTQNNNWYQLIVVIMLAAGAAIVQIPLHGERPTPSGSGFHDSGLQTVEARLWQDPFGAIQDEMKSVKSNCNEVQLHNGQVKIKPCQADSGAVGRFSRLKERIKCESTHVLFALVPGGNSIGADESRRRKRFATLAGLNASGYVPEDPEHIGLAAYQLDKSQSNKSPFFMPFEWFTREGKTDKILLLWLDEQGLLQIAPSDVHDLPLRRLEQIRLDLGLKDQSILQGRNIDAVIGPSSSTFFTVAPEQASALPVSDTIWYSPYATSPFDSSRFPAKSFHPVNADDEHLAQELASELNRRLFFKKDKPKDTKDEPKDTKPKDAIALVGQWDTSYSRTLRKEIKDELRKIDYHGQILEASFLQGIDGVLPQKKDSQADKDSSRSASKDAPDIEHPEGHSQIDYLRRLAQDFKKRESDQLVRIRAIGIIGNDYHDKLLALKALKPQFPSAVFFTTDLNAAMLHPGDNKFTRNLIVASGYHLSLADKLQADIPPFRDSYQTAGFFATQAAIHDLDFGNILCEATLARASHIFEIGRSKAIDLISIPMPLDGVPPSSMSCLWADGPSPHPARPMPPAWWKSLIAPAMVLFLLLVTYASGGFTSAKTEKDKRARLKKEWIVVFAVITIVSFALNALLNYQPNEREPFGWIQGVSIWPSEMIRLVAFGLAILMLQRSQRDMDQSAKTISDDYFPETKPDFCGKPISVNIACQERTKLTRQDCGGDIHKAEVIWNSHKENMKDMCWPFRFWRPSECGQFLVFFAVFVALMFVLAPWLGMPVAPVRGKIELWIDRLILIPTAIVFMRLAFVALQASNHAIHLSRLLARRTEWPEGKLNAVWPHGGKCDTRPLDDWLDTQLIAAATEPVQKLIFWPFIILTLLIVARTPVFDGWDLPPVLAVFFGSIIVLLVVSALRLRWEVERVRHDSVITINKHLLLAQANKNDDFAKHLGVLLAQAKELRAGAFAPFTQQPLIRAAITLIGSLSGLALLDYVNMTNL